MTCNPSAMLDLMLHHSMARQGHNPPFRTGYSNHLAGSHLTVGFSWEEDCCVLWAINTVEQYLAVYFFFVFVWCSFLVRSLRTQLNGFPPFDWSWMVVSQCVHVRYARLKFSYWLAVHINFVFVIIIKKTSSLLKMSLVSFELSWNGLSIPWISAENAQLL